MSPDRAKPLFSHVLFDVGDTLVPATRIAGIALSRAVTCLVDSGMLPNPKRFEASFRTADAARTGPRANHLYSSIETIQDAAARGGVPRSDLFAAAMYSVYREEVRKQLVPCRETIRLFAFLSSFAVRIGVVTDGTTSEQIETLFRIGVLPYVGAVVTSEAVGVTKPCALLFERAMFELGAGNPSCTLMVGDSVERDVVGAKSVGMKTALLAKRSNSSAHATDLPSPDFVINHISEVRATIIPADRETSRWGG